MRIIIAGGLGAIGEVRPFIDVGAELKRRGHHVEFVANPWFASAAADAGLTFVPVGSVADQEALLGDAGTFGPERKTGRRLLDEHYFRFLDDDYGAIRDTLQSIGPAVIVGNQASAALAAEKYSLPRVRLVLSPARLPSRYDPPHPERFLPGWTRCLTSSARGMAVYHGLRQLRHRLVRGNGPRRPVLPDDHPLVRLRSALGLPPLRYSNHRARLRLCMWPAWFASPQRDWPEATTTVGFPLDGAALAGGREPESAFEKISYPVVATTGSVARSQFAFFSKVVAACGELGRSAVLVTPHQDHIPRDLPPGVIHLNYAAFGELFRRASVVIHHGGIGTTAHALAAGVPQIIAPMRGEQFDIANRTARLGVAQMLSIDDICPDQLAGRLCFMLRSRRVNGQCQHWQSRMSADEGARRAAQHIEALSESVLAHGQQISSRRVIAGGKPTSTLPHEPVEREFAPINQESSCGSTEATEPFTGARN